MSHSSVITSPKLVEAISEWGAQWASSCEPVSLIITMSGEPADLRSVIEALGNRISNRADELDNVVGGFIYPKFLISLGVDEVLRCVEQTTDLSAINGAEIVDIDIFIGGNDDQSFRCFGSLLHNAQTH